MDNVYKTGFSVSLETEVCTIPGYITNTREIVGEELRAGSGRSQRKNRRGEAVWGGREIESSEVLLSGVFETASS